VTDDRELDIERGRANGIAKVVESLKIDLADAKRELDAACETVKRHGLAARRLGNELAAERQKREEAEQDKARAEVAWANEMYKAHAAEAAGQRMREALEAVVLTIGRRYGGGGIHDEVKAIADAALAGVPRTQEGETPADEGEVEPYTHKADIYPRAALAPEGEPAK
jgi:DNA repair exonuclease SbcCD ATPase subunit